MRKGSGFGRIAVVAVAAVAHVAATIAAIDPAAAQASARPSQPAARAAAGTAGGFETKAEQAILVDHNSGTVLFEKNADRQFHPASLAKLMTIAVVFDLLKAGKLRPEQEFTVSEHAWRTGGAPSRSSAMFAPINSKVTINDLIQGIIVQSANDGSIAAAEGIAGTELAFSDVMNAKAREIGLTRSNFRNPTGLHDPDQLITVRDFAKLASWLVTNHPDLYKTYAQREFTYNKIRQLNRNPLLDDGIGADGLKTGFIKESGFNIVGSAVQREQRLILVMGGLKSEKERAEEARKLMEWGFRSFEHITLFRADEAAGEASVFGGAAGGVPLVSPKPIHVLVPRGNRDKLRARIVYSGPVKAPVVKGAPIGKLLVLREDSVIQETPLQAGEDVPLGSLHSRALDGVFEMVGGVARGLVSSR